MHQLGRIDIFLEVARQQSFTKAASILGISGPAASKQVMALEDSLGVKLLHRTTRMVNLTDEGVRFYERAHLALEELKDAAAELQDLKSVPKGVIRINAPLSFGQMHLLPVLSGFAKKYPDVLMDISLDDRTLDILAEGFDLVIRIGTLEDSSLIARQLSECPIYMVASPAYLKTHGTPKTPSDIRHHRMIIYSNAGISNEWRYKDKQGKPGAVRFDGVLRANSAEMMLQAALDGIGIAILPVFSVAAHLQAKQLVKLLPDYTTHPPRKLIALMPPNRYRSHKVKLLLDLIANACKAMPLG